MRRAHHAYSAKPPLLGAPGTAGVARGPPPANRFALGLSTGGALKTLSHCLPPYLPIGLLLPHEKFNPERKPSGRICSAKAQGVIKANEIQ